MAATTEYGANYLKVYQPTDGKPTMPPAAEVGGRLRVIYDSYAASSLASGSTIHMAKMPALSRLWQIVVTADDIGSAGSLAVGIAGSTAKFIAATVLGANGKLATMWPQMLATDVTVANTTVVGGLGVGGTGSTVLDSSFGYSFSSETDIIGTTASGAMTGDIKWMITYSVD